MTNSAGGKKKGKKDSTSNSGKPKTKDGNGNISEAFSLPEDQIKYLQCQTQALEIQLGHRSDLLSTMSSQYEEMKISYKDVFDKYEREKKVTMDITQDMTRQYKGMQDDLLNKINVRERTIQDLRDCLEAHKREFDKNLQRKSQELKEKDEIIECMRVFMESMCQEFEQMLTNCILQLKNEMDTLKQSSFKSSSNNISKFGEQSFFYNPQQDGTIVLNICL